ncbi:MAG: glycosyltransferase [Streptosporangiaceae bacterium]
MRALLLSVGSQGDVQPFAALAARLTACGHDAVLAAPALFGGLAAAFGVPFVPLDLDVGQVGEALAGKRGLRTWRRSAGPWGARRLVCCPG